MKKAAAPVMNDLPAPLRKRLDHASLETGRSRRILLRQALETYLEDLEDYLAAVAAKKRARSHRPFQEIARELGLAR